MTDRKIIPSLFCFFAAVVCFGQTQTAPQNPPTKPVPQQPATTAGAAQAAPANTTGTPPPPPATSGGQLTPPIQPKTPDVHTPPAVTLPPPPPGTSPENNAPLTADEAAQIALHNQPNVAIARAAVTIARGQVVQQQSGLLPSISFHQSYSKTDNFVVQHRNNGNNAVVTTSGTTGTTTAGTTGTTAGTTGTTAGTTGTTAGTTGATAGTTGTTAGTTGSTTTTNTTGGGTSTNFVGVANGGFSGGLTLNQLIFDFNHTRDLVRQAQAQERAAQHGYSKAQIDTILAVKDAYYVFVQDQNLVNVQQANVNAAQSSLDQAQASLNAGLGAPADVVNAKTNLANAVQALLEARQTALTARVALAQAMGIDPRTPIVPSTAGEPAEPTQDVNTLVDQALRDRPDIQQELELVRASGFAVSAARTANAPTLNLQVNAQNQGETNPLANQALTGALQLVWNFEDAGLTAGRIETAHGEAEQAKQDLILTTQSAISELSQAWVDVKTAEQRVDLAAVQVQNAQENYNLALGQYQAGVTVFVTVITAETQLVQAQADQVIAQANLSEARAQLTHALGH